MIGQVITWTYLSYGCNHAPECKIVLFMNVILFLYLFEPNLGAKT